MSDDTKYELSFLNESANRILRSVRLSAKDPENDQYTDMVVSVTMCDIVPDGAVSRERPRLDIGQRSQMTREQWELIKRLGDAAWNEYERRFP